MSTRPYKVHEHVDLGYEVWARWDPEAEIFELFTERECESYIGFADTKTEARKAAKDFFQDLMSR